MKHKFYLVYLLVLFFGISCQSIQEIIETKSARESYLSVFENSNLGERELVQKWSSSWEEAKSNTLNIELPYLEKGIFFIANPSTTAYSFFLKEGSKLIIEINSDVQVFGELFLNEDDFKSVQLLEQNRIEYTIKKSGNYSFLFQADFLNGGKFTLKISTDASVGFPVSGKTTKAVKSFWGANRDGGKRSHKGIDIFAKKGTPVVAVKSGVARADNNNLGGKVVWLYNAVEGKTYYYAHLDSQRVKGSVVNTGDTLGFVGNTGNAKSTPPHLHFGIYKRGKGAVDPLPFVDNVKKEFASIRTDTQQVGLPAMVNTTTANLRRIPSTKSNSAIASLQKNTPLTLLSATADWYRVQLENGLQAFLHSSTVKILAPIQAIPLNGTFVIKDEFGVLPADTIAFQDTLAGYAYSKNNYLVQKSNLSRYRLNKLNSQ